MPGIFFLLGGLMLLSAAAAMGLRNPVHCALSLVMTFVSLAALFLQLDAQFVGLAQILVYVGAVAILIVFAILLTRSGESPQRAGPAWGGLWPGLLVAVLAGGSLVAATLSSPRLRQPRPPAVQATVKAIGVEMMKGGPGRAANYVLPLEVVGLLLTAAMIGAGIIAIPGRRK